MTSYTSPAATIKALRAKTKMSLYQLSVHMHCHINTLKMWERDGTNSERVRQLLELVEQLQYGQLQIAPTKRRWYKARARYLSRNAYGKRTALYDRCMMRLFFPESKEHLHFIAGEPTGNEIGWLIREANGAPYRLHLRDANGFVHVSQAKPIDYWREINLPIAEIITLITKS